MKYIVAILIFFCGHQAWSQRPIEVTVQIDQPYPLLISEYIENLNIYTLTVWNHTYVSQEVTFGMEMVGNNGVRLATNPGFRSEPIMLDAQEITVLAGPFLEDIFSDLTIDDVIREGVDDGIFDVNAVLPEGEYMLCVYAYDLATDVQLSVGCSFTFVAGYGVTPEIIEPRHNSIVPSDANGTAWILWDLITTNAMATGYEYNLMIKDVTHFQGNDPDELMSDPAIQPHTPVALEGLTMDQLLYNDDGANPLEYGHLYALRVQAIDPMGDLATPNSGYSATHLFWYGTDSASIENQDSTDEVIPVNQETTQAQYDCLTNCHYDTSQISTVAHADPTTLNEIQVGHFTIKHLVNINVSPDGLNGEGIIKIDWLKGMEVLVEFTNLRVNADGRVFDGKVVAQDQSADLYELSDIHWSLQAAEVVIPDAQLEQIHDFIQAGRLIDAVFGNEEIGVPFGISDTIQGRPIDLNVTNIEFTSGSARFDLLYIQNFLVFGEDVWFAAGIADACLTPGGIANEYILHQAMDLEVDLSNGLTFGFNGTSSDDDDVVRQNATFLEMDCNGMKSLALRGYVKFPTTTLVKDSLGQKIDGEQVRADYALKLDRTVAIHNNIYAQYLDAGQLPQDAGMHFLASVTMDDFQIAGVDGWSFSLDSAFLDLSDLENPQGMQVPEVYGNGGDIDESWQGFYAKRIALSPPKIFGSDEIAIEVTGMMIDPEVTLNFGAADIIQSGNLQGFEFTMDSLGMTVVQNQLQSGYLKGEIGTPIMKDRLDYIGLIDQNDDYIDQTLEYSFSVIALDTVDLEMMAASGRLFQNSHFSLTYNPVDSTDTSVSSYLAGYLTINSERMPDFVQESSLASFVMPEALFELGYHSRQGLTHAEFGWITDADEDELSAETLAASAQNDGSSNNDSLPTVNEDQGNISGFKINVEDIDLEATSLTAFDFIITPSVTLMSDGEGFGGSTTLRIHSQLNTEARGIKKIRLAAPYVSIDAISLSADMAGVELDGSLEFYNDQSTSGVGSKGVRGDLSVIVPGIDAGVMLAGDFGTKITNPSAPLGTADYYNYWYVNGKAFLGSAGLVVPPGFMTIHGLGGMVGVNMAMPQSQSGSVDLGVSAADLRALPVSNATQPAQSMALPLVPTFGARRVGFTLIFSIVNQELINFDAGLAATWQPGRGITEMTLTGDCYVMTPINKRDEPKLRILSELTYLRPRAGEKSIEGDMQVFVNFGRLRGGYPGNKMVDADFHYQNYADDVHPAGFWNFTFGTYDQPGLLDVDLGENADVRGSGYFMAGHAVPTVLPPLPDQVQDLLDGNTSSEEGSFSGTQAAGGSDRSGHSMSGFRTGNGLAFGASLAANADFDINVLYGSFEAIVGFDINITQDPARVCLGSGQTPGNNGWYGTGQAYAGLEGNIGMRFKMFGKKQDIHILTLAAALALEAGAPNPIWFDGRGMVYYNVLGGLVEGDVRFQVSFGDRCNIGYGDPLASLGLIDQLHPSAAERGRSKVFPDVVPVATFAVPMNDWMDIPMEGARGEIESVAIRPYLDEGASGIIGPSVDARPVVWNQHGTKATFGINQPLQENTNYDFKVRVRAQTLDRRGQVQDYMDGNKVWQFDTTVAMRTADLPYPMHPNMVLYTTPHQNQRYFLQNEHARQGKVQFRMNQNATYFPSEDEDGRSCNYFLRLSSLDLRDTIRVPISIHSNAITFLMPTLQNNTIYAAQLIVKKDYSDWLDMLSDDALQIQELEVATINTSTANKDLDVYSNSRVHQYRTPINPEQNLDSGEKLIYSWFFKTSRFNTVAEKMQDFTIITESPGANQVLVGLDGPEGFDRYDVKGKRFNNQGVQQSIAPRIQFSDPFESSYHDEKAMPLVNELVRRYEQRMDQNPVILQLGNSQWRYNVIPALRLPDNLNLPWNSGDDLSVVFNQDRVSRFRTPLRENEIESHYLVNLGIGSTSDYFATIDFSTTGGLISPDYPMANTELQIDFNTNMLVFADGRRLKNWSASILTSGQYVPGIGYLPVSNYFNNNFTWFVNHHDRLADDYQTLRSYRVVLDDDDDLQISGGSFSSSTSSYSGAFSNSYSAIFTATGTALQGSPSNSSSSSLQETDMQIKLRVRGNRFYRSTHDQQGTARTFQFSSIGIQ